MKISIVTAYYNRKKLFCETLKSISKSKCKDFEIIAVDDASLPEERIEDLTKIFPFLKVIRVESKNKCYFNSCIPFNIGIAKADGDIIMLQNPECLHVHDVLNYVTTEVNETNYITMSAYSIGKELTECLPLQIDKTDFINYFKSLPQQLVCDYVGWYNHSKYNPCYFHFCVALTKKNMKLLGGFDERYASGIGFEDNDFVSRVEKLGLHKIINDDISVIHQWHPKVFDLINPEYGKLYTRNENLYGKTKKEKICGVNNSYMNNQKHTIVLVLKDGKDFSFRDVELIAGHINAKWKSQNRPRVICLWDKASVHYDLGNVELMPLGNDQPGTWSRMALYSPEMEKYRPFLYVDLDTVIVNSLENIFALIKDPSIFITLEDFWQKGKLATALAWIPAKSAKIDKIWKAWKERKEVEIKEWRMDYFLRSATVQDVFWQDLTNTVYDFKPKKGKLLEKIPGDADLICFHGKPRIPEAAKETDWVKDYVNANKTPVKVTVIIPYKKDRGWLQDAINSVPNGVQLIVSQGKGNWPQNFNRVLNQAEGNYIKYLHEDDMLTENCIEDSVRAIEDQGVDFIHGDVIELYDDKSKEKKSKIERPSLRDLLKQNVIHSASTMYRREVFEKIGRFDETLTICEEYEFNLRCLHGGMKIGYCASILAYYRRHPKQNIRTTRRSSHLMERIMVKNKYK